MFIRKETTSDIEAITQVTIVAFTPLPISNHTEQFIIEALRQYDPSSNVDWLCVVYLIVIRPTAIEFLSGSAWWKFWP